MSFKMTFRKPGTGGGASRPPPPPKKAAVPNPFGASTGSDSEEEGLTARDIANRRLEQQQMKYESMQSEHLQKALREDPSMLEYDNFLDAQRKKEAMRPMMQQEAEKRSRYRGAMKVEAERRLVERDAWRTVKAQRRSEEERIALGLEEGEEDEKFVTGAYKEKLDEIHALRQKEAEEERLEQLRARTKKDFGRDVMNFRLSQMKGGEVEDPDDPLTAGDSNKDNKEVKKEKQEEEEEGDTSRPLPEGIERVDGAKEEKKDDSSGIKSEEPTLDEVKKEEKEDRRVAAATRETRRAERKLERWARRNDDAAIEAARQRFEQRRRLR